MILVENKNILRVFDKYEPHAQGYLIDGCVYPVGEIYDVVVPENIVANGRWCYDQEKGFYENPAWLQSSAKAIQDAIDAYNLELIELGVM